MSESFEQKAALEGLLELLALRDAVPQDLLNGEDVDVSAREFTNARVKLHQCCEAVKKLGCVSITNGLGLTPEEEKRANLSGALDYLNGVQEKHTRVPDLYITRDIVRTELRNLLGNVRILDRYAPIPLREEHYYNHRHIDKDKARAILTADMVDAQAGVLRALLEMDDAFLRLIA
ncbi:MAG: hypothetical protein RIQ56_939 [Candidatus Parcubacteria bacterium]